MRGDGMQHSEAATTSTSGLPPVRWHLGKPTRPHDLSYWPDGKGALNMKALGKALLVLLSVGVAAPAAARPRVPAAAWPGVSDVLRNLNVAAPVSARPLAVPVTAWLGLTDLPVAAVSTERAMWCGDFSLQRLVAEFSNFDGTETYTGNTVPGIQIYHKTITVP